MLHGGRARGLEAPTPLNLPSRRLRPFAGTLARAAAARPAVVAEVRYRCRGWNGRREDPARDALAALEVLLEEYGQLPVVLLGHSMGGRAALRIGGHEAVRGVVALAPWCPEYAPTAQLAGKPAVLLHADRDHMTDPKDSWAYVERARAAGALAHGIEIPGSDHAMLRRRAVWHHWVERLVAGMLGPGGLDIEELPRQVVSSRRTRRLPGRF